MTKYREILRLASLGINQTGIASSCGCARKTVRNVLNRAKQLDIAWPLKADTTDADLEKLLFLWQEETEERLAEDTVSVDGEIRSEDGLTYSRLVIGQNQ